MTYKSVIKDINKKKLEKNSISKKTLKKNIDQKNQGKSLMTKGQSQNKKLLYIESYGCQMNFSDSEIIASILEKEGYNTTDDMELADLVFVNTCSVRDKAEETIKKRLQKFHAVKRINKNMKIGLLGCMAERLKEKLLEGKTPVDIIVGPDAYKDLPQLVAEANDGRDAINVILSKDETYGDISPVRLNSNGVSAFVSITRGCDNMCTFCIVPFTRGRERSRNPESILSEIQDLQSKNYKEITLLGQNVDSYLWYGGGAKKDFDKADENARENAIAFDKLLDIVALEFPKMRIRFSTSNPYDMSEKVLHTIAKHHNICKHIHLPVQSGSTKILEAMHRNHTREEYISLIDNIRKIIPKCSISHDMIIGFPGETEDDHEQTLSLMKYVNYDFGYMFSYSERPGTLASKKLKDDIPEKVKQRRLSEVIAIQRQSSADRMKAFVGTQQEVLIEKVSKKSKDKWSGRNSQNAVVVFDKKDEKIGDFVIVQIKDCTSGTLIG